MLQNLRESITGVKALFFVGIISVPFAFWGIDQFRSGGGDPVLAKVGDTKIKQSQFRQSYDQRYQQLAAMMGENFRADLINQELFRNSVLDDMVQESLLRQYADKRGYSMSDAAVLEYIRQIPAFQEDGKFNAELYRNALAARGQSPASFEKQLREGLELEQLRLGVLSTAVVSEKEVEIAYRLQNQQRYLAYAVFKTTDYTDVVEVSEEEIEQRYDSRRDSYKAPERTKLSYIDLDLETLKKADAPADDVLKLVYEAEKQTRFSTPEERKASHILVSFGADKSAAKEKIEAIAAELKGGADFAELAKEKSDDTGSATVGGDLGWVRRGQMVEAFEETLFDMKKSSVSAPVETDFGWHIIKLTDVKEPAVKPFSDETVKQELVELYQSRESEKHFQDLVERLKETAFENSDSLEASAAATSQTVKNTSWVTRNSRNGIMMFDGVREAAFGSDVRAGENSQPIAVSPTRVIVLRSTEYEAARQRPLEEVRVQIQAELIREKSRAKALEDAKAALDKTQSGTSLEDAVKPYKKELRTPGLISRENRDVPPNVVQTVFSMSRPTDGKSVFDLAELTTGDAAVVGLVSVKDGDFAKATDEEKQGLAAQLRNSLAGAQYDAFRATIKDDIKVKLVAAPGDTAEEAPL